MTRAVIETGGKQYHVQLGQLVSIEKIEEPVGSTITFDRVLLVADGDKTEVGSPVVANYTVTAEIVDQFRGDKVRVFTYKSKKRQRRTLGHRQDLTKVKITGIDSAKKAATK